MIKDYLLLIFKDVKGRKFSSLLTFFAISLGILSIFVIVLVGQGFEQSIQEQFEQLGSNRIYITASGSSMNSLNFQEGLTDSDKRFIESKPYISEVYPYFIKSAQVKYGREYKRNLVLGASPGEDFFKNMNLEIEEGRFPKENERYYAVVGPKFAEDVFNREVVVGSSIEINGSKFNVIGILKSWGNPEDDKSVYVNFETIRDLYGKEKIVHYFEAKVRDEYDVNTAASNLERSLENRLGEDKVNIRTLEQMLSSFTNILDIVRLTLGGIALITLLVGALGIINTMYVIITEKTKDIGIMKAIGARNLDIFMIYVLEAGLFGLIGGIVGIALGSAGALGFEAWAKANGFSFLNITINVSVVVVLLVFSFLVGAIAGFLPSYKASRLNIVEAFRR